MSLQSIVGITAGILTALSLLPQLTKMIAEKKATDISVKMLVTLLSGLALWVWYGILRRDWPIIITNSFSLVVNILIIALHGYYKRQGR